MNKATSTSINFVRFPLAILVVFIHSIGTTENIAYYAFREFFSHIFCSFVVPTFFIISGYLFFQKTQNNFTTNIYIEKIKSRFFTLVIPYIVWNTITLSIDYTKYIIGQESWINYGQNSIGYILFLCFLGNPSDLLEGVFYPINLPLWYIRDLIVLCIISPLLYFLLKKKITLIMMSLFLFFYLFNIKIPYFNCTSIVFFSIGAALSIYNKELIYNKWYILLGTSIMSLIFYYSLEINIALKFYTCSMPFVAFHLGSKHKWHKTKYLKNIANYSTIIYYSPLSTNSNNCN